MNDSLKVKLGSNHYPLQGSSQEGCSYCKKDAKECEGNGW